MGNGMPYHLEKGPLLRIIERHINGDRSAMETRLQRLNDRTLPPLAWLAGTGALWGNAAFDKPGAQPGPTVMENIATEWFGYSRDPQGNWQPPNPAAETTGYWIGYKGDVEDIVRGALAWALELALAKGGNAVGAPWPIELFWKCPTPWFEAWVAVRPGADESSGSVTVTFMSPSHHGAIVARSPIATSPVASPPGCSHPIPSTQDDYELLGQHPHPVKHRPRVAATSRRYATWVVSQEEHDIEGIPPDMFTAIAAEFGELRIPQLARWTGVGNVVVVAPSMAAGGVKHNGGV